MLRFTCIVCHFGSEPGEGSCLFHFNQETWLSERNHAIMNRCVQLQQWYQDKKYYSKINVRIFLPHVFHPFKTRLNADYPDCNYKYTQFYFHPMTQVCPNSFSLMQGSYHTRRPDDSSKKKLAQTGDGLSIYLTGNSGEQLSSLTERQILSHALIKEVVNKSKSNTIQHHVNTIPSGTKLYKLPLQRPEHQFIFDTIPPNNPYFISESTQKVQQIHHRLSDNKNLTQRVTQKAQMPPHVEKQTKLYKRPSSASNTDRRVSVSGLVSYNFNSVTARRSLGSIPDVSEEQALLVQKLQVKRRNSCSINRQARIIRRKPNPSSVGRIQFAKAAVCDFTTSTDLFLRNLIAQKRKDEQIYGESMQKINCVKQYMEKQRADYDEANFIVNAVVDSQKKQKKQKKEKQKVRIDDELELSKRRRALSSRKVMLRQLYFTE